MNILTRNIYLFISLTLFLTTSCGVSKETLQRLDSTQKENVDLPLEYTSLFPSLTFEQWDKDYNIFYKFLTHDVTETQVGLSYTSNGVHTWWCSPSVQTHVQLDTATMINDNKLVLGEWRILCNRKITFVDSANYADQKIYRNSKNVKNEKEDDLFLSFTADKFKLYLKKKGTNNFINLANKNYQIKSGRYLMLFNFLMTDAAVSFIGIDKEGRLIINAHFVQERKIKGKYVVYEANVTQFVFKRML